MRLQGCSRTVSYTPHGKSKGRARARCGDPRAGQLSREDGGAACVSGPTILLLEGVREAGARLWELVWVESPSRGITEESV